VAVFDVVDDDSTGSRITSPEFGAPGPAFRIAER
jgi:hypothetical protein